MFGKFKDMVNKIVSAGKFEYVIDVQALEKYLNTELQFSLENELEACVDCNIFYKGEKHSIYIWNYVASSIKSEKEKGLSVTFDKQEYNTIDSLLNNAVMGNTRLIDIKDYFVIGLNNIDSDFLQQYKAQHPALKVEDYKQN